MARVLRGEVRWVHPTAAAGAALGGDSGHAVLILSADVFTERSGTAICAAVTSEAPAAAYPLFLKLGSRALPRPAWVCIGQVQTVPTDLLGGRAGRATAEELSAVLEGLREILGDQ